MTNKKKRFSIFAPKRITPYESIEYGLMCETNSLSAAESTIELYCITHGLDPKTVWLKDNEDHDDDISYE